MTKHVFPAECNPSHNPSFLGWRCDAPRRGYIIGSRFLFKAIAVIDDVHIQLGTFVGRAQACRAIVEAHGGEV